MNKCVKPLSELFENCLNEHYIDVANAASYALEKEDGKLFIYFEWSNGKEDWKNNLDFPCKPYKEMGNNWYCHRGFLRVWQSVKPYIKAEVKNSKYNCINIVGYSHGAALAVLAHEYVWFNRPDLRNNGLYGYGFGCPRVFWGVCDNCAKDRWKNFTVIRNGNDLVTFLPPKLLGYRHVGNILKIGESVNPIKDHTPDRYKIALGFHRSKNIINKVGKALQIKP